MQQKLRACVFIVAAVAVVSNVAEAGPAEIALQQQLKTAAVTVVGQVVETRAVRSQNAAGDDIIITRAMVRVTETLRGPRVAWLPLELEGGTLNGVTLKVSDVPQVQEGDRAVFLADRQGEGFVLHGRGAGVLALNAADGIEGTNLHLDDVRRLARAVR